MARVKLLSGKASPRYKVVTLEDPSEAPDVPKGRPASAGRPGNPKGGSDAPEAP